MLTVSQLTRQVKDTIEPKFARVIVRGEISNFRGVNARGHYYFALSDARSSIDVKLWATTAARLKFQLQEGLSVVIEGSLDVYEPQGRYSLIVDRLEPEGLGAQALRFEQLKQKLVAEGLIGDKRTRPRRPLPFLPRRIGVVTSISGAALRDFLKVLHRRHPGLSVLVADARVQGDNAPFELRRALRWLANSDVDVIVVTRGGGSADDLAVFNEEPVVRALWACEVPVVTAVGHEIDTTLSDLVADVRAPTPSAAAELIAPSLVDLTANLATLKSRLYRGLEKKLLTEQNALKVLQRRLGDPRRRLSTERLRLSNAAERLRAVLSRRTRVEAGALGEVRGRLQTSVRRRQRTDSTGLGQLRTRLLRVSPRAQLQARRERFTTLARALERQSPRQPLARSRAELLALKTRLATVARRRQQDARADWRRLTAQLDALSPLKVLQRGYALARRGDEVIRAAGQLSVGDQLTLSFAEGRVEVQVTSAPKPRDE